MYPKCGRLNKGPADIWRRMTLDTVSPALGPRWSGGEERYLVACPWARLLVPMLLRFARVVYPYEACSSPSFISMPWHPYRPAERAICVCAPHIRLQLTKPADLPQTCITYNSRSVW
jgi:hypothetical protein